LLRGTVWYCARLLITVARNCAVFVLAALRDITCGTETTPGECKQLFQYYKLRWQSIW